MSAPQPPMPKVNVSARLARLAASCMATMDIRYYLCGIYVAPREAGGAFIVATDGHRLMAVIDASGDVEAPAILRVPPDMLRKMPRPSVFAGSDATPAKPVLREVRIAGRRKTVLYDALKCDRLQTDTFRGKNALVLTDASGEVSHLHTDGVVIEGKFPDFNRVLPQDFSKLQEGVKASFNHGYLMGVLNTFKGTERHRAVQVRTLQDPQNQNGTIAFHIIHHEYALLVIMPMRGDEFGVELFNNNWSQYARRERRPADKAAQEPVAVPAERGADAEGGQAAAGGEPAAKAQDPAAPQG